MPPDGADGEVTRIFLPGRRTWTSLTAESVLGRRQMERDGTGWNEMEPDEKERESLPGDFVNASLMPHVLYFRKKPPPGAGIGRLKMVGPKKRPKVSLIHTLQVNE
jgi:hypothetical protein